MRLLRSIVVTILCAGGIAIAQGQVSGGDPAGTAAPSQTEQPHAQRISSGVMQKMLLKKVDPVYPLMARQQHLQAMVVLHAIIGKDGHVEKLDAVQGPDVFRPAAIEAVRKWVYKPYVLNGEVIEVDTTIVVPFSPVSS
jgi:periplasmic protein TonB